MWNATLQPCRDGYKLHWARMAGYILFYKYAIDGQSLAENSGGWTDGDAVIPWYLHLWVHTLVNLETTMC